METLASLASTRDLCAERGQKKRIVGACQPVTLIPQPRECEQRKGFRCPFQILERSQKDLQHKSVSTGVNLQIWNENGQDRHASVAKVLLPYEPKELQYRGALVAR